MRLDQVYKKPTTHSFLKESIAKEELFLVEASQNKKAGRIPIYSKPPWIASSRETTVRSSILRENKSKSHSLDNYDDIGISGRVVQQRRENGPHLPPLIPKFEILQGNSSRPSNRISYSSSKNTTCRRSNKSECTTRMRKNGDLYTGRSLNMTEGDATASTRSSATATTSSRKSRKSSLNGYYNTNRSSGSSYRSNRSMYSTGRSGLDRSEKADNQSLRRSGSSSRGSIINSRDSNSNNSSRLSTNRSSLSERLSVISALEEKKTYLLKELHKLEELESRTKEYERLYTSK